MMGIIGVIYLRQKLPPHVLCRNPVTLYLFLLTLLHALLYVVLH